MINLFDLIFLIIIGRCLFIGSTLTLISLIFTVFRAGSDGIFTLMYSN